MSYESVKRWRDNNKVKMVESFGGSCGICGYDKCIGALEFHHLDPTQKDFAPSKRINSWTQTVQELRKCVLLCANCHREVHMGITTIPCDIRRFDESYAEREYKKDELDCCPICGKIKSKHLKSCSRSCAGKMKGKVNWDEIDVPKLLTENNSLRKAAESLGISDSALRKRIRKMNIVV